MSAIEEVEDALRVLVAWSAFLRACRVSVAYESGSVNQFPPLPFLCGVGQWCAKRLEYKLEGYVIAQSCGPVGDAVGSGISGEEGGEVLGNVVDGKV